MSFASEFDQVRLEAFNDIMDVMGYRARVNGTMLMVRTRELKDVLKDSTKFKVPALVFEFSIDSLKSANVAFSEDGTVDASALIDTSFDLLDVEPSKWVFKAKHAENAVFCSFLCMAREEPLKEERNIYLNR